MSNEKEHILCTECGGTEFELSSGLYYCNQCQTQSQNVQDFYMDNFEVIGAKMYKKKKTGGKKKVEKLTAKSTEHSKLVITEKCTIMQALLREQIDWLESEGHIPKTTHYSDTFRQMCREIWFRLLETQKIYNSDYSKWTSQIEPKFLPAILYLAGVYSGNSICMFQLSKWIKSGTMPFFREFYAKRTITLCNFITFGNTLPYFLNTTVNQLMGLLKIPVPKLTPHPVPIINALLDHLHLPMCLQKYVEKLLKIVYRNNKSYLSPICHDYAHTNESQMLSLIICLLRILYCFDGEEENTMERCWDTNMEVRYLENVDEECDYIYLWNDWMKLYTLDVLLRNDFKSSTEVSIFPQLSKQTPVLSTSENMLKHYLATELATYSIKSKREAISIDLIDIYWKAVDNHKKRAKTTSSAVCATHGDIDGTVLSIIKDVQDNFTPRGVKIDKYFKDKLSNQEFTILIYKIKNLSVLDWDMVPDSFSFILDVCSEMMGVLNYQLFEIVAETMASIIEATNTVLVNNPV
ncbi:hypothetical protein LOD99_3022 [Oopsacas minuta]|uniref:Rrn7/TAF1B C-terminal cyclin domain-containing protein n=1 Tax=Oopsacas minuta TaxID=111878 RepID=A0AAV7JZ52_9METZ|nr:hypothetical protein LOD99_3022 [Oopsacas minuta]